MGITTFKRAGSGLLAAAGLCLGLAGPAHAIIYVGTFDPAYDNVGGGTYNGVYGYRGQAKFSVADNCLNVDGFNLANTTSCGALSVLSASLTVYEIAQEATPTPNSITHDTAGPTLTALTQPEVYGVIVKNGKLDGVVTNYFGGVDFLLSSFAETSPFSETLWMRFFDSRVTGPVGEFFFSGVGADPVDLCNSVPVNGISCPGTQSNPSNPVGFTQVPEPASVALALLALAAGGVATARRQGRPAAGSAAA